MNSSKRYCILAYQLPLQSFSFIRLSWNVSNKRFTLQDYLYL